MPAAAAQPRLRYLDNLRLVMIILVVLVHTSVTYSGLGGWYYRENDPAAIGMVPMALFGAFNSCTQAYFMGLLFLIAGYFTPASFDRKGAGRFARDRLVRLGLPSLLFMLVLNPLTVGMLAAVLPGPAAEVARAGGPLRAWGGYLAGLGFLGGSGPLWFALALLAFSLVYATARAVRGRPGEGGRPSAGGGPAAFRTRTSAESPAHRAGWLGCLGLGIAVAAFLVRLVFPIGSSVLNMQLCYFAQYVILYAVGIRTYRSGAMGRISGEAGRRLLAVTLAIGIPAWFALMVSGGALQGRFDELYAGGLHWQSAAYALWESLFAVGMCFGLIAVFRARRDTQGPVTRFLSDNAFAVYVCHAPVLVGISLASRPLALPPLAKFALVGTLALAASFGLVAPALRRIPGLGRIL